MPFTRKRERAIAGARGSSTDAVQVRRPSPDDGASLWALASRSGLDANSPYAYLLWCEHFATTSAVAVEGERLVGFVTGFREPRDPTTLFVWQIAVEQDVRGRGVGARMLDELVGSTGARFVDATVNPSNLGSAALFRSLAGRHGADVSEQVLFPDHWFPDGHEAEVLFRVGPLPTDASSRSTGRK